MNSLCPYKQALGVPNQGIHSYRFFGVAIADVLMTLAAAAIFSYTTGASFLLTTAGLFLAGIALHRLFCVRTTVDTMLFPSA